MTVHKVANTPSPCIFSIGLKMSSHVKTRLQTATASRRPPPSNPLPVPFRPFLSPFLSPSHHPPFASPDHLFLIRTQFRHSVQFNQFSLIILIFFQPEQNRFCAPKV